MKNVTVTLEEEVAAWARVEAAKAGKSLSRYLGDLLAERRGKAESQREALARFLNAPDFPGIAANLPSREELYAERLFSRHERDPVRERPKSSDQTRKGARMAKRSRR